MRGLDAGGDSTAATVYRIETVRIEVMRHTARTTDTGDNRYIMWGDAYLSHALLQRHAYRVITASRTKTYVLIRFKITCLHNQLSFLQQTAVLESHYIVLFQRPALAREDTTQTDLYSIRTQ